MPSRGFIWLACCLSSIPPLANAAWGYACDSYVSLQVVLTSSVLVTATATNQYADFFRAMKGGGSRFGIITSYEVQAIHVGTAVDKTWYGGTISSTQKYTYSNTNSHAGDAGRHHCLFYNGTQAQFNTVFAEFLAIPALVTFLSPLSCSDMGSILPPGDARTSAFGASALYPHNGLFQQAFANEIAYSILAFTPAPQTQIDTGHANRGNAFAPRNGAFATVQLSQAFPFGATKLSASISQGIDLLLSRYGSPFLKTYNNLLMSLQLCEVPRSAGLPLYLNETNERQNTHYKSLVHGAQGPRQVGPAQLGTAHLQASGHDQKCVKIQSGWPQRILALVFGVPCLGGDCADAAPK
ncbi:hypothetical protein FIBSPDRAFT_940341 [Athelia psychrophila]|uniref:Carboxylic ester hydrolase n=1 Tax=Athelia psychrophila TaxID=1759441 RepID=A0A167W5V9_9AGAM|nr:hypothetical protein FIBSPDRAFT_940341 [Fibularhizoctonia sp. CBS 109695]